MALVLANRVQETTTTTGTGTVTLAGAMSGFQSFAVVGNTNTTYYAITSGTDWEVGIGTYSTTGPTLARTTILSSSIGGGAITLAGTSIVFSSYPAEKVISDGYGLLPVANGGTNATTAGAALTSLGAYPAANPSGFTSNTGTVTSVNLTAGTGVSVSGGPVTTSGAITVTNTAPDQVVSLTGAGTTVVTGTYPSFTITSTDSAAGTVTSVSGTGTVSGLTLTGTVTTSGSLTLGGTLAVTPSNFASQTAKTFLAAPNGAAGVPSFRAIIPADVPTLNQNTTGTASNVTGTVAVANGGTGTTTAFTAGSVVFAGASGVYSQDNASFFWDDTNNRLGIGINTPAIKLQVSDVDQATARIGVNNVNGQNYHLVAGTPGASNSGFAIFDATASATRMYLDSSGNFGIGTVAPATKLEVAGATTITNGVLDLSTGYSIRWGGAASGIQSGSGTADMVFTAGSSERMRVNGSTGNVGIGTSSPGAALDVAKASGTFYVRDGTTANAAIFMTAAGSSYAEIQAASFGINFNMPLVLQRQGGNVGIGTSVPYSKLDTAASGGATIGISNTASGGGILYGKLAFYSADAAGAYKEYGGQIQSYSGAGIDYGDLRFYTANAAVAAERMRITSAGNLGIGISAPSSKLDVDGTTFLRGDTGIFSSTAGAVPSSNLTFGSASLINAGRIYSVTYTATAGNLVFATSQSGTGVMTDRMFLDSAGNVGIGTASPAYKLDVNGAINVAAGQYIRSGSAFLMASNGGTTNYSYTGSSELIWRNGADTAELMRLTNAGNVGIGTSAPISKLTISSGADNGILLDIPVSSVAYAEVKARYQGQNNCQAAIRFYNPNNAYGGAFTVWTQPESNLAAMVERMRVTPEGAISLGSGTATENSLMVYPGGVSGTPLRRGIKLGADPDGQFDFYINSNQNNPMFRWFNGLGSSELMRLNASGDLLVGTATASNTPSQGIVLMRNTNVGSIGIGHASGTADGNGYLQFAFNGSSIGSVTQSGSGTAVLYNVTSDARLKKNVANAEDAASLIDALQVRKFDWKSDDSHHRYGFVAQELVAVAPEAVSQPQDPDEMMGVDYSKLVPMLVKEIQSLRARVAQLEGN